MKKRFIFPLVVVVAIVVLLIVVLNRRSHFYYAGTVEATEVDVSSRLNAVIETVNFREGDTVKKGGLMVSLSCDDVRVAAEAAQRDYNRAVKLLQAGSMNQESFDRLRFKYEDSQVRLGWAKINSPLDGTVLSKYHEPGELVTPGTKLFTAADLTQVWAYIYVPQPMLSQISLNMKVNGILPEAGNKAVTGTIIKINSEAEFTPKNVQTRKERTRLVYGVKIQFENKDLLLKPGMTIEMKLPHGEE